MKLLNGLQSLYLTTKSKPWRQQKPIVLQFPVNDICNSKCQMCNIWEQKYDNQITPEQLEKTIANPLFSEVQVIGINGGEPTLRKDLGELVDVLFTKLPSLKAISLITNSLNSSQVIERITEVGNIIKSHHGRLDVMVSLDGVGEIHDRVRGRQGNFNNVLKVIDFIQKSNLVSVSRLGCTVIKDNVYGVHDLLEFALSQDIYIKYRLGIPHQRLYSKDVIEPFDLTFADKYHLAIFLENLNKFYEKSDEQRFFYTSLIDQLMYQKPRTAGCDWQHRGATLSARGELLYCAVASKTLGSAISEDAEKLYFDNNEHLGSIIQNKCASCTHDYVGIPPKNVLIKSYAGRILSKLGFSIDEIKTLKGLKSVKLLKQQRDINSRINRYGIKPELFGKLQPAKHFPHSLDNPPKVLICGWYGTETLGDKAILGGVVKSLHNSLGKIELHLASLEEYISQMTIEQMPELQGCKLHSIASAVTIAKSMNLVVFGGGPLMAIAEVVDMLAIFQKAAENKVPTLVAGCGVGPLGEEHYNDFIKNLLLCASHRIYRDRTSLEIAESLGVDTSADAIAEDPAFTYLENSTGNDCNNDVVNLSQQSSLILGLRNFPYEQYAHHMGFNTAKILKERFEKEIILTLEQLLNKYPNLKIIPFPMCTNHMGGDDRWFYRDLFRKNQKILTALDMSCLGAEIVPSEAIKVFKSASVALTMRFHALVFALSAHTPTVAIDYTLGKGKVKSLAQKHSVPYMGIDRIDSEFMVHTLSEIIDKNEKIISSYQKADSFKFTNYINEFIQNLKA
ncbi:MAG: polysaccharide pyruvyl transferase family protein [Mastigocoleus sp.]